MEAEEKQQIRLITLLCFTSSYVCTYNKIK